MSQLYIRLRTGFFTHRKTVRLFSIIGEDAYWIVPRLWCYAAEHQPDGDFSGYSSMELALLVGCNKHSSSILQALKESGYLDQDGKLHDWEEHNGYHERFSERAKTAAAARWSKEKSPTPPKEEGEGNRKVDSGDKHCSSNATSISDEDWRKSLAAMEAYRGINIEVEFQKMSVWCETNRKQPSRKRFANWLNRIEKPMAAQPIKKKPLGYAV